MHIFITGGNGFIGKHLGAALLARGHVLTVTGTRPAASLPANVTHIVADTTRPGKWQEAAADAEVLINLAGRTIFKRWTKAHKQQMYDSRILTTRHLVAALPAGSNATLISVSAVGYYGNRGEEVLSETEGAGTDFLAHLSQDWEMEALMAEQKGARVVIPRFGVVLGREGGALPNMMLPFKFFMGGPIGNGRHWISWIHVRDLTDALLHVMTDPACRGRYNFTAPEPVRYRDLASALGRALNRPSFVRTPAFMIRLALGEMAGALLGSQRVLPRRLFEAGYGFQFPDITSACADLVRHDFDETR